MSSYFDERARQVAETADADDGDDGVFLLGVICIEAPMIDQVNLVTGDREFPDDLRQRIQGAIATKAVGAWHGVKPLQRTVDRALRCRTSLLVEELHDLFHEVARRRRHTRFGYLSDSPEDILARRDEHDLRVIKRERHAHGGVDVGAF